MVAASAAPVAAFEARCACCNYGVVVRMAPERCPMCGTTVWEYVQAAVRRAA